MQPEKTQTSTRTQPAAQPNDPASDNAKPKTKSETPDAKTTDDDGFTLAENVLITTIATALGMKPEEVAALKNLLSKDHAAIKPLADMIGKLATKEIAAFVKGKFVEMSVHENILAKMSYLLGHTNADKSPIKSLRLESDGVSEDNVTAVITGESVAFRAIATYGDGSERDITNLVLWKLDAVATEVTQDSLSPYRLRGEKDGAAGKFTATLPAPTGDLQATVSFASRKAVSQSYRMFVEKDGEAKTTLALGLFFKVRILADVVDFRGKIIATVDKTDSTPVTLTQSAPEPLVVRSTVFGSPVYRSYAQGTQNFGAMVDGQQLSAALTITPAVELFKYIAGSEDYAVIPHEECGSILKSESEKTAVSADGDWMQLVGDNVYLTLFSVLSTCDWVPIEGVKFLPADVYVPTESQGQFILGQARTPDQAGSVTTAAGQPITTLNKLTSDVKAKQLTAVVFAENLETSLNCERGGAFPDQPTDSKMGGTISKFVYAVFNQCRVESFDTADTGIFEVADMNPANVLTVAALSFGQVDFAPNPARGLQEQTVVVTMTVNASSLCYPTDTGCVASAQRNATQSVTVPGALPFDISFSEAGLTCSYESGKMSPEPEFVRPGATVSLSLFYAPLGTDSNGNCLAIPFTAAMKAATQLDAGNVTITDWSLTAPTEGDFQVTARYTSGDTVLSTSRYFIVEASGQSDWEGVRPLFENHCQSCHNQVAPDLGSLQSVTANRPNVLHSIQSGQMPPNGMLPSQEKQQMISFLEGLSGGGGSSGSSDLEIKQTREDDRHIVKVDQIQNGNVVRSETFDSPGAGKKLILPDFCSQASTCLKVTFIGGITQEAGNAQCVFVNPQSADTVKVDVDTNGAGFIGTCKPDEDETYYFSCPNSPGTLTVAGCS